MGGNVSYSVQKAKEMEKSYFEVNRKNKSVDRNIYKNFIKNSKIQFIKYVTEN